MGLQEHRKKKGSAGEINVALIKLVKPCAGQGFNHY